MTPESLFFVSPLLAMPQQHGGCVYPDAVLHALHAAGYAIDYTWLAWPLGGRRMVMRDPLRAPYVRRGFIPGTFQVGEWRGRRLAEWFRRTPAVNANDSALDALPGINDQTFFRDVIRRTAPRQVLVDFATTLPALDALSSSERSRLSVAVLTHNLNSRRTELYRKHGQALDFRPMTVDEEIALLERADIIVAIQEREAEAFRAMLPHKTVVTVPMPMQPHSLEVDERGAPVCLFVGGYSGHNLAGLDWLLREVWPVVLKECPTAELRVAGTVAQAVPKGAAGVRALGPLKDLREAYTTARVALAPLPMGTGLKIKVIEAMGWGRPVVTTTAGAEGFTELERGDLAIVADSPEAFSAAILRLLRSPEDQQRVARRQLAWIEERFAPAQAITPLLGAWRQQRSPDSGDLGQSASATSLTTV